MNVLAYGLVHREGGSVASASYLILERLLDLGHAVEFHAIADFIVPEGLIGRENFTYLPTKVGPIRAGWTLFDALPGRLRPVGSFGYSLLANAAHERVIAREARRRHAEKPFDALLVLGLLPPFRVPGLPCVCWPQGAPNGEWDALRSLRSLVMRYGGAGVYHALAALYSYKQAHARRAAKRVDLLLCGSRWSVENWVRLGVPRNACWPLPYPVDLDTFRLEGPSAVGAEPGVTTFLWLGRVVPRKRLDLLLDAYALLRRERSHVRLRVVGRFAYVRAMRALLDRFGPDDGFEYQPHVDRAEVPALLRSVDVLVQPSMNEDVGSSVLEALACGVVPVVGPSNGTRDYLSPSSVVFDAYTPEALKDAMLRADEVVRAGRAAFAAEARATAERLFSVNAVASRVISALGEARQRGSIQRPVPPP